MYLDMLFNLKQCSIGFGRTYASGIVTRVLCDVFADIDAGQTVPRLWLHIESHAHMQWRVRGHDATHDTLGIIDDFARDVCDAEQ